MTQVEEDLVHEAPRGLHRGPQTGPTSWWARGRLHRFRVGVSVSAVSHRSGSTAAVTVSPSSAARRSLQHDIFQVLLQDGVLDSVEDKANIFRVHCRGEVVEQRLPSVSPLPTERLHQERLHKKVFSSPAEGKTQLQTPLKQTHRAKDDMSVLVNRMLRPV